VYCTESIDMDTNDTSGDCTFFGCDFRVCKHPEMILREKKKKTTKKASSFHFSVSLSQACLEK
jgi:hypothetical protein